MRRKQAYTTPAWLPADMVLINPALLDMVLRVVQCLLFVGLMLFC
jgi:hypothetical protein